MSDTHIMVLPGGAYTEHADHEAEPVADWLTGLGHSTSVFRYPVATRHPGPLDAVRAQIRERRSVGFARVGVLGFSAGGHLAGHAALAADSTPDERPDLAILCYPVTSMELPTHVQSRDMLLGPDSGREARRATSLDRLVTPEAPPMFIWHTAADVDVPPEHAYRLASALAAAGVSHELHVFDEGAHGLGLAPEIPDTARWTELVGRWLAHR